MEIVFDNVSFKYEDKYILRNFNIKFSSEEFTVIKGENGCGKTTLSKLIINLLKPTQGMVLYDNEDITKKKLYEVGEKVAYLFQNPSNQIFTLNVEDELGFTMKLKGCDDKYIEKKIELLLEEFDIQQIKQSYTTDLSEGEKQRLALATLFVEEREMLILDEPTKSLDYENRQKLINYIKNRYEKGTGVILISHYDEVLDYATRIITLDSGGNISEDRRKS